MKADNSDEIRDRLRAFRLFDKGISPARILKQIARSSSWLFKWKKRYEEDGWDALDSPSRAPQHSPQQYSGADRRLVLRIRRRLEKATAGLSGPRAMREALRRQHRWRRIPALTTIKRWLQADRAGQPRAATDKLPYYPEPKIPPNRVRHSSDWIARYLPGGVKVFAFHTIDHASQALGQTLRTDKSTTAACDHLLASCRTMGLPDFLQLDNDAAFTGLGYTPRVFGRFVRLALYLGIELIFIPPGEPARNGLIERTNGLWAAAFWNKNHFPTFRSVRRKAPQFLVWYQSYAPPALGGRTVAEATRHTKPGRLTARQRQPLPEELPLTAGRIHYLRRVSAQGEISLLKENWPVSRRLAGQYVWATLDTARQELSIYYRRSEKGQARLLRRLVCHINEPVRPLRSASRRHPRRSEVRKLL